MAGEGGRAHHGHVCVALKVLSHTGGCATVSRDIHM